MRGLAWSLWLVLASGCGRPEAARPADATPGASADAASPASAVAGPDGATATPADAGGHPDAARPDVSPTPAAVRGAGEACDLQGRRDACAPGLACRLAGDGAVCVDRSPPVIDSVRTRWDPVGRAVLVAVDGRAAHPVVRVELRTADATSSTDVVPTVGVFHVEARWGFVAPPAAIEVRVVDAFGRRGDPVVAPIGMSRIVGPEVPCDPAGRIGHCADGYRCAGFEGWTTCRPLQPVCVEGEEAPAFVADPAGSWTVVANLGELPVRDAPSACATPPDRGSARFVFTAPAAGTYRFAADDTGSHPGLSVRGPCADGAPEIACVPRQIAPALRVDLDAGQEVVVLVDGFGPLRLHAAQVYPPVVDHIEARASARHDGATKLGIRFAGHDPDGDADSFGVEGLDAAGEPILAWESEPFERGPSGAFEVDFAGTAYQPVASVRVTVTDRLGGEVVASAPLQEPQPAAAGEPCDPRGLFGRCPPDLACTRAAADAPPACGPAACPDRHDAVPLVLSHPEGDPDTFLWTADGDTTDGARIPVTSCGGGSGARIYRLNSPGAATLQIHAWARDGAPLVVGVGPSPCPDEEMDCGRGGLQYVPVDAGETLYIVVDGDGGTGPFHLEVVGCS
jgi:hypothetical protein